MRKYKFNLFLKLINLYIYFLKFKLMDNSYNSNTNYQFVLIFSLETH